MYLCLNRGTAGGKLSLEEFVATSSAAGFAGCDVDLGYAATHSTAALRDLYAKHNQKFGGWGPGDWRGDAKAATDAVAHVRTQAKVAAELGIDSCATWIMPAGDLPLTENFAWHVSRLKPVAAALAEHGRRLGLEFVAPYHHRIGKPHEFLFTPGQMLELAAAIGPNVGLLVDCFHLYCAGVPASYVATLPLAKIVLVHVNDAPRVPVAEVQDFARTLPGEGAIDQGAFRAALTTAGYDGPVSLEVFNAPRLKGLEAAPAAHAARDQCRAAGW